MAALLASRRFICTFSFNILITRTAIMIINRPVTPMDIGIKRLRVSMVSGVVMGVLVRLAVAVLRWEINSVIADGSSLIYRGPGDSNDAIVLDICGHPNSQTSSNSSSAGVLQMNRFSSPYIVVDMYDIFNNVWSHLIRQSHCQLFNSKSM